MSQPIHEIEKLLTRELVEVPPSLKGDVESVIEISVLAQTRRDDLKWLAISFGAFALSIGFSLALLSSADRRAESLSNGTLTITEDGRRLVQAHSASKKRTYDSNSSELFSIEQILSGETDAKF